MVQIDKEDKIKAYLTVPNLKDEEFLDSHFIVMATKKGQIKKTSLRAYSRVRVSGINAITIHEGDELLEAKLTDGNSEIMMAGRSGMAVRFNESQVRTMGRTAAGVRGIRLKDTGNDEVIGMVIIQNEEDNLLVISEKGYGKQTNISEYRLTNRGGKGVKTLNVSDKTGQLISIKQVEKDDDIMIITRNGITIRMSVDGISTLGRNTQGVRLIRLKADDEIASVAKVAEKEEEVEENEEANAASAEEGTTTEAATDENVTSPETDGQNDEN
jgi:DNA gyrase subunit A